MRFVTPALLLTSMAVTAAAQQPTTPPPSMQPPSAPPAPPPAPAPAPIRDDVDPSEPPDADWEVGAPNRLDVGLWLGLNNRLDEPPLFPSERDQGLIAGVGFDLFFSRRVSLGLHYEHVELGAEGSGLTRTGTVHITRRLDDLWIGARMYPLQLDGFGAFLGLGVGLVWQTASLGGSVWLAENPSDTLQLRCTGHGSVNAALRGEVGADAQVTEAVRFIGGLGFESYRLSDQLIGDCVPGAGTAVALGLRAGLVYGIDL